MANLCLLHNIQEERNGEILQKICSFSQKLHKLVEMTKLCIKMLRNVTFLFGWDYAGISHHLYNDHRIGLHMIICHATRNILSLTPPTPSLSCSQLEIMFLRTLYTSSLLQNHIRSSMFTLSKEKQNNSLFQQPQNYYRKLFFLLTLDKGCC